MPADGSKSYWVAGRVVVKGAGEIIVVLLTALERLLCC